MAPCGGYRGQPELFANSCFARHCCGEGAGCNYLCPKNPRFVQMYNEVNGLRFEGLPELIQQPVSLPRYVPSVLHRSKRARRLDIPTVAIPVEGVVKIRRGHMRAVADSPEGLREHLRLGQATRVLLNCVRQDDPIEKLWEYWVADQVPAQLRRLGIDLVIAPNFSHLRGVPRLESVGNRMRQLICVRDLIRAGLPVAPHLSVLDPQDWEFWRSWLVRNPTVTRVAFEFETGYKSPVEGLDAIARLASIQ